MGNCGTREESAVVSNAQGLLPLFIQIYTFLIHHHQMQMQIQIQIQIQTSPTRSPTH